MAVAWVGVGSVGMGAGPVSPTWATGHAADDYGLLVIITAGEEAPTLSTPAGFTTQLSSSPQATGTTTDGTRLTIFEQVATSGAMATPTVADPGDHVYARIFVWRGTDLTAPVHQQTGSVKATASTSATWPTVTSSVVDCLMLFIGTWANDASISQFSGLANDASLSLTARNTGGTSAGHGGGLGIWEAPRATAGTSGVTTATMAVSTKQAYIVLALQPPASAVTYNDAVFFAAL